MPQLVGVGIQQQRSDIAPAGVGCLGDQLPRFMGGPGFAHAGLLRALTRECECEHSASYAAPMLGDGLLPGSGAVNAGQMVGGVANGEGDCPAAGYADVPRCPGGEMADTGDSKSSALAGVRVRIPPRAPEFRGRAPSLPRCLPLLFAAAHGPLGPRGRAGRLTDPQQPGSTCLPSDRVPRGGVRVSKRVVIAEDEAIIRLDLREMLEDEGYVVVAETGRGDEAVELARQHQPEVCIFDIQMPGRDGLDAAREVAADRTSAVLILTAFSKRHLIAEARDAGVLSYLVKPFQREELVSAIEVAWGRFTEMRELEDTVESLEEKLETRKAVERAKGLLMDDFQLAERDAFEFIRSTAMANRAKMRDIAQQISDGLLTP